MNFDKLIDMLIKHEGSVTNEDGRHIVYEDSVGVLTIGYGRNCEDWGLSEDEASLLLENDAEYFYRRLVEEHPIVRSLKSERQIVLTDMAFNLGIEGIGEFVNMWDAINRASYGEAAQEMKASLWCKQVGYRCEELAEIMRRGEFPEDPNQETGEGC